MSVPLTVDQLRAFWDDIYKHATQELLMRRGLDRESARRGVPFEALVAAAPTVEELPPLVDSLMDRAVWRYRYWWPWTELE